MKLYLVQHGEAMAKEQNPDRPLTTKGQSDVGNIAGFLKNAGIKVDKIIHSGKTRAEQTSRILASALNPKGGIIQKKGIAPNDPIEGIYNELMETDEDITIVGHLPYLGKLASALLIPLEAKPLMGRAGPEYPCIVAFQQGGVVSLERKEDKSWHIVWMITPSLLS